ncbi:MAG TPA: hypothetical protein VFC39_02725 [Acidobacteriaceae bacterium]|nr:hypothetical protein [Acidobacteriaceae bacterium]
MSTMNTLFAILAVSNAAALEPRIQSASPWLNLKVGEGQWLLIAPAATTTKEISDRLGITETPGVSNGIVLRVETYFGRNPQSVWEWITAKKGAELGSPTTI